MLTSQAFMIRPTFRTIGSKQLKSAVRSKTKQMLKRK
jgi:hypothetical protein